MTSSDEIVAALADPVRLRIHSLLVLAGEDGVAAAELEGRVKGAARQVPRLLRAGLITRSGTGALVAVPDAFRRAAEEGRGRRAPQEVGATKGPGRAVAQLFSGGRLVVMPVRRALRRALLEHLAERFFEPGRRYTETEVNTRSASATTTTPHCAVTSSTNDCWRARPRAAPTGDRSPRDAPAHGRVLPPERAPGYPRGADLLGGSGPQLGQGPHARGDLAVVVMIGLAVTVGTSGSLARTSPGSCDLARTFAEEAHRSVRRARPGTQGWFRRSSDPPVRWRVGSLPALPGAPLPRTFRTPALGARPEPEDGGRPGPSAASSSSLASPCAGTSQASSVRRALEPQRDTQPLCGALAPVRFVPAWGAGRCSGRPGRGG